MRRRWSKEDQKRLHEAAYYILLVRDMVANGELTAKDKDGFAKELVELADWVSDLPRIRRRSSGDRNGRKGGQFGNRGGAPKGNANARKQPQNNPKTTPNENEDINVNVNANEGGPGDESPSRKRKRFVPQLDANYRRFLPARKPIADYLINLAALAFGGATMWFLWQIFQTIRVWVETAN